MSNRNPLPPCTCPEHDEGAPTVVGEHEFACDYTDDVSVEDEAFEVRRWLCSCGDRGDWKSQSHNAAYHGWLRHCGVAHDYAGEG